MMPSQEEPGVDNEGRDAKTPRGQDKWQELADHVHAALISGDSKAAWRSFGELQSRSHPMLMALARRQVPTDLAEDLVAEVYADFLEYLQGRNTVVHVKALLKKMLASRISDHFRSWNHNHIETASDVFWSQEHPRMHYPTPVGDERRNPVVSEILHREAVQHLNNVLDGLPADQKDVLSARYLDALTVKETADFLNLRPDQVKKRTGMGLKRARELARRQGFDDN